MTAPTVFISYSQDSNEHKDRVLELANRLRADGIDATIDQYETSPAEGWPKWMDRHISKDDFVLVICTETYHRRVMGDEEKGKGRGIKWESTLTYQHIYDDDSLNTRFIPVLFDGGKTENVPMPLKGATFYFLPSQYDKLYHRLIKQPETVKPELGKLKPLPPLERKPDYLGIKISLAKLPSTDSTLFGREERLKQLDEAWDNPKINIITLVAWGGVGKSALVNKWLTQMARDNYRGAERVYGWSFYSQGAREGAQNSSDQFIAAALAWFGDPDPTQGSPWDKGERLAELVKQCRALIILDGLEPLQNPPPVDTGRIKDPALTAFLRELASQNPGLLVVTTRLAVDDLKDFVSSTTREIDLESLSDQAGADYLRHLGVDGTDEERKEASHDFGGHALALTLMGSYLRVVHRGDIRKRKEIPHVMDEQKQGKHARRVMHSYEVFLKDKPELDILRLMGLFDRPAEKGALDALRKKPAIKGLTTTIQKLKDSDWQYAINNLRDLRLISQADPHEPDTLDCHPLLREHFGEQLKVTDPAAWREGNNRLYEWYKASAKELPDTLQEMAPLFAAVIHGCQAGKHQEAYDDVYRKRIRRGNDFFNVRKLGAIGSELAVLSGFFDSGWNKPVDILREDTKATNLNTAGYCLRALGRLAEAAQPLQSSLEAYIAQKNWAFAARIASNISELYLSLGDVTQALAYAEQSVALADQSGDEFLRMVSRAKFALGLHQAGRFPESKNFFHEAEELQKKRQPEFSILYSLQGFNYCDLLLSQGDYAEVERRASQTLEIATKYFGKGLGLLDIALDNLSLGRAQLLHFQRDPKLPTLAPHASAGVTNQPITFLNRAVDGLRQAGQQQFLPLGLLARAEYYRVTGELTKSQKDLDEAFSISTRGGMGLFLADCHLEYATLNVKRSTLNVQPEPHTVDYLAEARKHLAIAKEMIEKMGYHRRDKEVEELEKLLAPSQKGIGTA
jgi:tetratricopeptide (TPR) repeat protein